MLSHFAWRLRESEHEVGTAGAWVGFGGMDGLVGWMHWLERVGIASSA